MNEREREILDKLITPLNGVRESWERKGIPPRTSSPQPIPSSTPAPTSVKRSKERRKQKETKNLPRWRVT